MNPSNPGTTPPAEPGKVKVQVKVENSAATGSVNGAALKEALKQPVGGKVTIEVTSTQPISSSSITIENEALRAWLDQTSAQLLVVATPYGSYELPKTEIDLQALAAQAGSDMNSLQLVIQLAIDADALKSAASKGYNAIQAVSYTVTVKSGNGKTATLDAFQSYVKRSLNVDKSHALTDIAVVRVDGNGEYTPVPFKVNGQRIDVYSRTNSTYLVLQNPVTFQDIASHWSKGEVESLAAKMIVTGRTEQSFVPNAPVTRAEFAALVVRALGLSADAASGSFQDVASTDWYAGAIQAAVDADIINGYTDGTFKPNRTITREEMAVMAYNALEYAGYNPVDAAKAHFADASSIGAWSQVAVYELAALDILNGDPKQRFNPKSNTTRGESAAVLHRLMQDLTYVK